MSKAESTASRKRKRPIGERSFSPRLSLFSFVPTREASLGSTRILDTAPIFSGPLLLVGNRSPLPNRLGLGAPGGGPARPPGRGGDGATGRKGGEGAGRPGFRGGRGDESARGGRIFPRCFSAGLSVGGRKISRAVELIILGSRG
ncbi:hypothetical protein NL676_009283 [Syzygium grande]|nr:hypothetical protein NL676_009283 [Syzygium grande]